MLSSERDGGQTRVGETQLEQLLEPQQCAALEEAEVRVVFGELLQSQRGRRVCERQSRAVLTADFFDF